MPRTASAPVSSVAPRVPYLTKTQIRREAAVLLAAYAEQHGAVLEPPVPVDEVLEVHLKLSVDIADLHALFGGAGDVLGAIWFADRRVRVDASLDPARQPRLLGRYRFTLAHEAGHWCLHRRLYLDDPNQQRLFGGDAGGGPAHVCRSGQAKEPMEWQADYFAGQLLMPSHLVRAAWEAWRGNPYPAGDVELVSVGWDGGDPEGRDAAARRFVRPLADRFEASADAMRIRLEELGLLAGGDRQPNLI